ncbi:hypothetical protein pb186bvf_008802 [Paramecium bursaria]
MLLKYMYSQKQDGDFVQMFKIYLEPEPLTRTNKIQQFLKSRGIKRVSSVLIPILLVTGFAYVLPGNTYGQYFIKTKFAELKIKYYRFLQHYSDHPKRCKSLRFYLNDQFLTLISVGENPSELYGNIITQMTQTLYGNAQKYILDDSTLIDFVIIQLDILNARVVENNYFDVYRVYSNQIIDLIDLININLKEVSEQRISNKYYQFELVARGLVTCFLGCLKYTQDKKQRIELYNYSYQINQNNSFIKQKLYDQFKSVLPEVYRDIAVNDQQLNLNALQLINQIANSNIKNSLLNQLVQDQLPSNLLKHKYHKDIQLDQQIIYFLNLILNQKEVLYSLKNIYDQEHKNILEQLNKHPQDKQISFIINLFIQIL